MINDNEDGQPNVDVPNDVVVSPVVDTTGPNSLSEETISPREDAAETKFDDDELGTAVQNSMSGIPSRTTNRRHIGLKRSIPVAIDENKAKRGRGQICSRQITVEMIQALDPNLSQEEVNAILQDYAHATRIMNSRQDNDNDPKPSLEYMIKLINDWKPRREIICMYVRWSKRLRRNFHLDSISTLLCVAKQCDYTPYVFLKKIKTLSICRSTTSYGINFKFDIANNADIDGKKLNDKFLGLSITLRLLQRDVVPCSGTLGMLKFMRYFPLEPSTFIPTYLPTNDRNDGQTDNGQYQNICE